MQLQFTQEHDQLCTKLIKERLLEFVGEKNINDIRFETNIETYLKDRRLDFNITVELDFTRFKNPLDFTVYYSFSDLCLIDKESENPWEKIIKKFNRRELYKCEDMFENLLYQKTTV